MRGLAMFSSDVSNIIRSSHPIYALDKSKTVLESGEKAESCRDRYDN